MDAQRRAWGTACCEANTDISWRKVPLTWEGVSISVICFAEVDTLISTKYGRPGYHLEKSVTL